MTDSNTALERARREVEALGRQARSEFRVLEQRTLEGPAGWIFFYDTKKYAETGRVMDRLAGNAPLFVDRSSGIIKVLPARTSAEEMNSIVTRGPKV